MSTPLVPVADAPVITAAPTPTRGDAPPAGSRSSEYAAWLDAVPRPVVALDATGLVLHGNPAALDLLDMAHHEAAGRRFQDVAFAGSDGAAFREVIDLVRSTGPWSGHLRMLIGGIGGTVQEVGAHVLPVGAGDGTRLLLTIDGPSLPADRTTVLSERLTGLAHVAAELQTAPDLPTLTDVVVEHLAGAAGATVASLSLVIDPGTLTLLGMRGARPGVQERWSTYAVDDRTPAGVAVLQRRAQLLVGRDEVLGRFPDLELATDGERTLLCLPLVIGDQAIGVATLSFPSQRVLEAAELDFYQHLADSCAQAVERMRALETVAEQNDKLTLLADAATELASSLDYEATLRQVAQLAVPDFADWCSIALEQDGFLRTLAVAHRDPSRVELAQRFEAAYPPDPDAETGAYAVLRSGRSLVYPDIPDALLVRTANDVAHLKMLRELDLRSVMTVALCARDRVFGTVTWVRGRSRRPFRTADLIFAEDLAGRAAVAIDNSVVHSELREVADRLQAAVRPPELPELPGWQLSACYASAGRVEVGGDFYDVVPLQDGRLALAIGDVMGRGVEAAAAMAQIRAALRAFIAVDPEPESVLSRLDMLYEQYPTEQLVTMLYAVADPAQDLLSIVSAGHPAPLLVSEDGSTCFVEAERGTLLGIEPSARKASVVRFEPGQTLVLFTDGLLERRGEDLHASEERLVGSVADVDLRGGREELIRLAEMMCDPSRDDDVAVLVAHRTA